jgi:F0F1-type ATP synthase membrane subunit b/b'
MSIEPDLVLVALQSLPFFLMIFGLHVILFKPMLAYLEQRREATQGAREEAIALQEKAELKVQQWEAALTRAHAEVADFRAQRRAEAQAVYARRIAQARAEADKRIGDQVAVIAGEASLAREEVGRLSRILADDMATRTLGRPLAQAEA